MLRGVAIVTMLVAVGCVLLPELDSFAWEKSYSQSHSLGKGTFLSALFDNPAEEDTDGDGTLKVSLGHFYTQSTSLLTFVAARQSERINLLSSSQVDQKYFLLHRKLLL
jgi:hypothetical protein